MYVYWRNNENICIALGFAFVLFLSLLSLIINQTHSTYGRGKSTPLKNCRIFDIHIQDVTARQHKFQVHEINGLSNTTKYVRLEYM
jgi:hypothetical protein